MSLRIDLYCRVVDNFGDAGVCWRLARQLALEFGVRLRLVIDRPAYVQQLAGPCALAASGIEVRDWSQPPADLPDVVIAAFQCRLPAAVEAMLSAPPTLALARANQPTIWINLDYLSAEPWVNDVHGRPSIKSGGATEWFFLPGFTPQTGGLIREREFDRPPASLHRDRPVTVSSGAAAEPARVSLFCYRGQDVRPLVTALAAHAATPIELLVTAGCDLTDIRQQLGMTREQQQRIGPLTVRLLSWMNQTEYDALLASCDLNFVRGEDSWIRAIWAHRPFVWSPYRQDDGAHLTKIAAFLDRMQPAFAPEDFALVRQAMSDWASNSTSQVAADCQGRSSRHWSIDLLYKPEMAAGFERFADGLCAQSHLASRLMAFVGEKRQQPQKPA